MNRKEGRKRKQEIKIPLLLVTDSPSLGNGK
jgi:hypothetical protein